jgi:hypothetical protein
MINEKLLIINTGQSEHNDSGSNEADSAQKQVALKKLRFENLPRELIVIIAGHLSHKSQLRLGLCSHLIRSTIMDKRHGAKVSLQYFQHFSRKEVALRTFIKQSKKIKIETQFNEIRCIQNNWDSENWDCIGRANIQNTIHGATPENRPNIQNIIHGATVENQFETLSLLSEVIKRLNVKPVRKDEISILDESSPKVEFDTISEKIAQGDLHESSITIEQYHEIELLLNSLNERIIHAQIDTKNTVLNLNELSLTRIPANIFSDASLTEYWNQLLILTLDNNFITTLPQEIEEMNSLEELYVNENLLTRVPNTPDNLRILRIDGNPISETVKPFR